MCSLCRQPASLQLVLGLRDGRLRLALCGHAVLSGVGGGSCFVIALSVGSPGLHVAQLGFGRRALAAVVGGGGLSLQGSLSPGIRWADFGGPC